MKDSKAVKVTIPVGVKLHKKRKRICPMFHTQVQSIA